MENFHTEPVPESKRKTTVFRLIIDIFETLALAALLFIGINALSARIRVDGLSMHPSLQNGDFILVNKLAYKISDPRIGDVIVFRYPRNPEQEYIKRVIGMPGDQVSITGGQVYVNGQVLNEPYIAAPPRYHAEWVVPENALFVLGDNRNNSSDSHSWGSVPLEYVIGKASFVYWPPERWGVIAHFPALSTTP